MKIKSHFMLKKVMGKYMIISTDPSADFSSMQTLNETGAYLWELLKEDPTIETMTQKMCSEYEIDEETAKRDITLFVSRLRTSSLLDE